jgi:nitrite reductase (NADH) large subunit
MPPRLIFDRERCLACRSCELACAIAHSRSRELRAAAGEEPPPRPRVSLVKTRRPGRAGARAEGERPWLAGVDALRCEQCTEPLCVFSCKTGALHRDARDGHVVFDEDRCVGCLMCVMVCPLGIRPDPARERVVRCDVCRGLERPACVEACPTAALAVAETEIVSPVRGDFDGEVVIVGSSAAGIAAAEAAREHAPACGMTVVTADGVPEYSRPLLAYVLAGRLEAGRLAWRPEKYLQEALGARVLTGTRASGLDVAGRAVVLADGRRVGFDRLIIATGAGAARAGVPGEALRGVHGLRDLADLSALEGHARRGAPAVVLGGGNVGLQVAEAWAARGLHCTLVVRSPHVLSQMVDRAAGERVAALFTEHGIGVRCRSDAVEILGEHGVEGLRLDTGEVLQAELVVVAKGIVPAIEWVRASGIRTRTGIVVDRSGRTSASGIFAAGDCAEMDDPVAGGSIVSGIWPVAYETGRAAGSTAVGVERATAGALRMNASRFFGVPIVSIGEVRDGRVPGAESGVLADGPSRYRKIVRRDGRLVGALLFGDIANAGLYYRLYREQIDLTGLDLDVLDEQPDGEMLDEVRALAGRNSS